jgi:hypothetical protein
MEYITEEKFNDENGVSQIVESTEDQSELKKFIVEYTGSTLTPESGEVTVEMIIEVLASEFPEFVLAIAEENWVRGYQQALTDAEHGKKLYEMDND